MDYRSYFGVEALIVLSLLIQLEVSNFLLEVECISHLIEQESEEEITPIRSETDPSCILNHVHTFTQSVAVRNNSWQITSN